MKPLPVLKVVAIALLIAPCAGCCCGPRYGITLRGGLDFREWKKPAGFVELVDTEWFEQQRFEDLKWLENADCLDEPGTPVPQPEGEGAQTVVPPARSQLGAPATQPNLDLPTMKQPASGFELPPAPEDAPPVPPPAPEAETGIEAETETETDIEIEADEINLDSSATLPHDYSDGEDYQRMIELTSHERAVRSTANRPTTIKRASATNAARPARRGGWFWSKP